MCQQIKSPTGDIRPSLKAPVMQTSIQSPTMESISPWLGHNPRNFTYPQVQRQMFGKLEETSITMEIPISWYYVSKIVRVTPEDFTGYARSRPTNTTKSLNSKISWEYFVQQCKEKVLVWIQLAHYNVVKVYGLQQNLNICVEYCPKGSLREYLREQSGGSPNKETIIYDVLEGIEYMHSLNPPVIHGNLNAGKIFIDAGGRTKIGEFGLTALCYHVAPLLPTVVFTGFNRWMSPELFDFQSEGAPAPTVASDMWALACTLFEIVSDKLPYPDYKHDIRVQRAILKGERPGDFAGRLEGNPGFWALVDSCWSKDPLQRPSIKRILTSYLEGNPRKAYSPLNQSANLPDVKSPEASEERVEMSPQDIVEKLEQVHIRGQEIGQVRERAEAIMEGIKRSLAAEREAEKAHREAVAARKREQKKLQALINETMVDNEGKDTQTAMHNLHEREPDAQKDDLERMDAQCATSEPTTGFDVDPAISRRSGVLPPLQQSTSGTVPPS
ncbi:hypothetical protein OPQ81_000066 [Rhizoctonia solani]|nr:hypothetical protein OPQ81_000066 [Rhizoctonia solani]